MTYLQGFDQDNVVVLTHTVDGGLDRYEVRLAIDTTDLATLNAANWKDD